MIGVVKITRTVEKTDLVDPPVQRTLATGKSVFVFNLKINPNTSALETGNEFEYDGEVYEAMNTYRVEAAADYLKLNSVKKRPRRSD